MTPERMTMSESLGRALEAAERELTSEVDRLDKVLDRDEVQDERGVISRAANYETLRDWLRETLGQPAAAAAPRPKPTLASSLSTPPKMRSGSGTSLVQRVHDVVNIGGVWTAPQVVEKVGGSKPSVLASLSKLVAKGQLRRVAVGQYVAVT